MKLKSLTGALAVAIAVSLFTVPVGPSYASGNCPNQKNGKCPQTARVVHKSSQFTGAQRAKLMEEARAICKRRYGVPSQVDHIDYYHWKVWCTEPGF